MRWRTLLVVLVFVALNVFQYLGDKPLGPRRPLPEYQPWEPPPDSRPLPGPSVTDPEIQVHTRALKRSAMGTAFALGGAGWWMTARHVVDRCRAIELRFPRGASLAVRQLVEHPDADLALLAAPGRHAGLPVRDGDLYIGQDGFFVGYPRGAAGEVWGNLMGRMRMRITGRYNTREPVLAWAERRRRPAGLRQLSGLSGGPALDASGRVVGVLVAESRRRGRVYSAAPESLARLLDGRHAGANPASPGIDPDSLQARAEALRRGASVANVVCFARLQRYSGS